jgi:hypothetical protein
MSIDYQLVIHHTIQRLNYRWDKVVFCGVYLPHAEKVESFLFSVEFNFIIFYNSDIAGVHVRVHFVQYFMANCVQSLMAVLVQSPRNCPYNQRDESPEVFGHLRGTCTGTNRPYVQWTKDHLYNACARTKRKDHFLAVYLE